MTKSRAEQKAVVMASLNAVAVGQLSAIEARLQIAARDLACLEAPELDGTLSDARAALGRGDLTNFRRLIAQTVSRLGHIK